VTPRVGLSIRSANASCGRARERTASARSHPAMSSASRALLTKSRVCPPSR
jgi:hypothetical protein